MLEQTDVLRRIDQRQAAADLSRQAIPQVPATSSSAWNPLLSSFLAETIQPKVERWRGGLDTLLVFLGLFSAIVTAFFVDSLGNLKQDQTQRTNELLANLTEIMLALNSSPGKTPNFSLPVVFEPSQSDIRVNAFYSISLIFSLTIAALVVAGRGFVNMIPWSRHQKATLRLADIYRRWDAAERILRPAIESLPQLLVLPVLLFLVGILDMLISTLFGLPHRPVFILATTGFCLLLIASLSGVLLVTLIDGSLHPSSSIFQSTLAAFIHAKVVNKMSPTDTQRGPKANVITTLALDDAESGYSVQSEGAMEDDRLVVGLSIESVDSYHRIVQGTHDDDTLEQAASALLDMLKVPNLGTRRRSMSPNELKSLIHFLSPEASFRSNRTAAEVLVETFGDEPFSVGDARIFDTTAELLGPLLDALERYHRNVQGRYHESLWNSPFTRAIATLVGYHSNSPCHPVIAILTSKSLSWQSRVGLPQHGGDAAKRILDLMLSVLSVKLKALNPPVDAEMRTKTRHTQIGELLRGQSGLLYFDLRTFLETLIIASRRQDLSDLRWIPDFIAWTVNWIPLDSLISDSLHTLHGEMLKQPWVTWRMRHNLCIYIELTINACVDITDSPGEEDLLNLCILCTSNALRCLETVRSRPPFVDHFLRTVLLARCAITTPGMSQSTVELHYRPRLLRMLSDIIRIKVWMDQKKYHDRKQDIEGQFHFIMDYVASAQGDITSDNEKSELTSNHRSEGGLLEPLAESRGIWIDEPRMSAQTSYAYPNGHQSY
ncbi:hypothetical protein DFH08DRAFT_970317 [Mycena albidolilacea]|uniref:DUF6535 domain-containing protein n=1 Tax=Mycena albidolilacea TaxID=1033008 RepID=A0AAD7EG46_9AGAR|nr:hypothetical protein DFH08DRAFT_970317 [Mycena albidolilacea]